MSETLEITLKRLVFTSQFTEGWMSVDGCHLADTLEDRTRDFNKDGDLNEPGEEKIYGQTAIPFGRYEVRNVFWQRHKDFYPELFDVKSFQGIFIHEGCTPEHTLGCILVGKFYIPGRIEPCGKRKELVELIRKAEAQGKKCYITIE